MPSLGEAPSGGAQTFWLLLGRLPKVTRCKSGTISRRDLNNGYAPKIKQPNTTDANICVDANSYLRQASPHRVLQGT
ncbi:hypothetical protein QF043_001033 [Pseudomonas sp. W3I7]|nr:hypothetical protein [Pseudomonas sp. W3I7]